MIDREPKVVFEKVTDSKGFRIYNNGVCEWGILQGDGRMTWRPAVWLPDCYDGLSDALKSARIEGMREAAKAVCIDCKNGEHRPDGGGHWIEDEAWPCRAESIHAAIERAEREGI